MPTFSILWFTAAVRRPQSRSFWRAVHCGPRCCTSERHVSFLSYSLIQPNVHYPYGTFCQRTTASFFSSPTITTARSMTRSMTIFRTDNKDASSWTREGLQDETIRLRGLLSNIDQERTMIKSGVDRDDLSRMKLMDIGRVMEGWVQIAANDDNGLDAAFEAHSLLHSLQDNFDRLDSLHQDSHPFNDSYCELVPDLAVYNSVMQAYAVSGGGIKAAEEAENMLISMIERCRNYSPDENKLVPKEPTSRSFNIVLNAWAKSGSEVGARRAQAIFSQMETWLAECREKEGPFHGAVPTARSLAAVMDALARSGVRGAAEQVDLMLNHMIQKRRRMVHGDTLSSQGTVVKVNRIVFNSAILAWVRSMRGQEAAEKAEELVRQMESLGESRDLDDEDDAPDEDDIGLVPDTHTLSLVIDAWASCSKRDQVAHAADRAQALLDRMETLYREGRDVKPNCIAFTTCMTAWSRCKTSEAAEKAEKLLDRLLTLYQETGDVDFRPTSVTGNSLIAAWAKSQHPESANRAEAVLKRLEEFCHPDLHSYNSLLHAYARSGMVHSALDLLRRLEEGNPTNDSKLPHPDTISYNTVIDALAKHEKKGHASRALALLDRMEGATQSGSHFVAPDKVTYTSVINAFAKSLRPDKADRAHEMLVRMMNRYSSGNKKLRPDVFACTACINACARMNGAPLEKKRALRLAIRVFERMQNTDDYESPNELTFLAMMRASSNLASNRNEEAHLLESLFQQSCAGGLLNKQTLEHLQRRLPRSVLNRLGIGTGSSSFPSDWVSNVASMRNRP